MAEIRRDPITGRWIIVSTDPPMGPGDFEVESHRLSLSEAPPPGGTFLDKNEGEAPPPGGTFLDKNEGEATPGASAHRPGSGNCPFCPGNEKMTPPEICAQRPKGGDENGPGWTLRVVPNKFPALRIEGNLNRAGVGAYDMMNGVGAHEVIIETPDHKKGLADFEGHQIFPVMEMFKERSLDLRNDKRFRYLLIFKNYGESAGASLAHPHSQLIALPIVPKRVVEELKCSQAYFNQKERCVFCDVIHQEMEEGERLVMETPNVVCFAPFVSRFPFELWILPKNHSADFTQSSPEEIKEVGEVLTRVLGKVKRVLNDPSYNFLIHTSPLEAVPHEGYHWHLEIMPRLSRVAGFEWGSGIYINPTPPESAANYLRGEPIQP